MAKRNTYEAYDEVEAGDVPNPQPPPVWQYQQNPSTGHYHQGSPPGQYYPAAAPSPQAGPTAGHIVEFQPLVQSNEPPPQDWLIPSILSCIFCNVWCGSMALAASLLSRGARKRNHMEEARRRGCHACALSIVGLAFTLVSATILLVLIFAVRVI